MLPFLPCFSCGQRLRLQLVFHVAGPTFSSPAWMLLMAGIGTGSKANHGVCQHTHELTCLCLHLLWRWTPSNLSSAAPQHRLSSVGVEVNEQRCWNTKLEFSEASTFLKLGPSCHMSYFHIGAIFQWLMHLLSPPGCKGNREQRGLRWDHTPVLDFSTISIRASQC